MMQASFLLRFTFWWPVYCIKVGNWTVNVRCWALPKPSHPPVNSEKSAEFCVLIPFFLLQLDGISWKQRSCKINMSLARIHQRFGNDRSAITAYKEVLRCTTYWQKLVLLPPRTLHRWIVWRNMYTCTTSGDFLLLLFDRENPLSLEAAKGLLNLGLKGVDVASLVMAAPNLGNMEAWYVCSCWLCLRLLTHKLSKMDSQVSSTVQNVRLSPQTVSFENKNREDEKVYCFSRLMAWNKGQASAAAKEYSSAVQTFRSLDVKVRSLW